MVQELGTVAVEEQGEVSVIRLLGEHDLATAGDLRRALEDAAGAGSGIIVSLDETEFIDASVIYELFLGDRMLRAAGRRLVLHVGTAPVVSRALDITNATRTLPCSESLEEALSLAGVGAGA